MFIKTRITTFCSAFLLASMSMASAPAYAVNETMANLLSILRDKGSITRDEYNALMNAARAEDEQAKKAADKQMADISKMQESTSWASKVKIKGDMRLRYQYQNQDSKISRERGRLRYRAGIIAKPLDRFEVGAGMASGGSDPRSTNQTFDSAFSTKGLQLDYAYVKYDMTDNFTAIGGKFGQKGFLWNATDLMWDGDINPEGISGAYNFNNDLGKTFLYGGLWVINESSSSGNDPFMGYVELGHKFSSGDLFATIAGTYYGFSDLNAGNIGAIAGNGNTDSQFGVIGLSWEVGSNNLLGRNMTGSLFGDYVNNTDTSTNQDTGYSFGGKLTNGTWTLKYIYANLDANAVPDFLPDSDRFDGDTNIRGHELIAEYNIFKHVTLGLDYYNTHTKGTSVTQNILQADVVVKF